MHTSPPVESRLLMANWMEVNLPKLVWLSPTVTVQQPQSPSSLLAQGMRQSGVLMAVPLASNVTTESLV